MPFRSALSPCLLLLALLLTACHDGRQMRQALSDLQARNQADSLLTDDSLALALTRYFDRHGTPNERMEAHYLLGRTYADRGEAPQAIAAYQTAAEQADTTATDCDYRLLCRVYSQMGYLLYRQNLMEEYLAALQRSVEYARMDGDTLTLLNLQGHRMTAYERLGLTDSVISVYNYIYDTYCSIGHEDVAACFATIPMKVYLDKGDLDGAKRCMNVYEAKSGYFNAEGDIEKGREIYYYLKGSYFYQTHQYDSAEHYFRKELRTGKDFGNQNSASRGLAKLYSRTHRTDSAAKFALYSYDMSDSVYAKKTTHEVARVQRLYNYTHQQRLAMQEHERANREERKVGVLFFFVVGVLVIASLLTVLFVLRRRTDAMMYQEKLAELERAQSDILQLRSFVKQQGDELHSLISEKEKMIKRHQKELQQYRRKEQSSMEHAESLLAASPVYKRLLVSSNIGACLSEQEWHDIHRLLIELFPDFYQFVSAKLHLLDNKKYRICILLRLHIPPSAVGNLLGFGKSYISRLSREILNDVFGAEGASKELASQLENI